MGYVQVLRNKTATMLKIIALVAYLVCAVLLNCSYSYRLCLFENGHSLVGFVPVGRVDRKEGMRSREIVEKYPIYRFTGSSVVELKESTSISDQRAHQKIWMSILHKAIERMLEPLKIFGRHNFKVKRKGHGEWQCFLVI